MLTKDAPKIELNRNDSTHIKATTKESKPNQQLEAHGTTVPWPPPAEAKLPQEGRNLRPRPPQVLLLLLLLLLPLPPRPSLPQPGAPAALPP